MSRLWMPASCSGTSSTKPSGACGEIETRMRVSPSITPRSSHVEQWYPQCPPGPSQAGHLRKTGTPGRVTGGAPPQSGAVEPLPTAASPLRTGQHQLRVERHGLLAFGCACREQVVEDAIEDLLPGGTHAREAAHERHRRGRQGLRRQVVLEDDRVGGDVKS